jgi:arginyl-tRNA synthetase
VFYVQYASARCHSVFRMAQDLAQIGPKERGTAAEHVALLSDPSELALIRKLAEYPRLIEGAALAREPHRVAFYLYDLASLFHAHWNKGSENPALRFVKLDDSHLTIARLGLVAAVSCVLASGLAIIGADAPEQMR